MNFFNYNKEQMKQVLIITGLCVCSFVTAQTEPKDIQEETKTVTTKINDGSTITEETVEYNTKKVQEVKLSEDDKNKINQDRVNAPVEVTETVRITNNSPFTQTQQVMQYTLDGKRCVFTMSEDGFLISDPNNTYTPKTVKQSADSKQFVIEEDGTSGIGFFDDKGNFIVQQFNKNTNKVESKVYTLVE